MECSVSGVRSWLKLLRVWLLRCKWENTFKHAVPKGSETSWPNFKLCLPKYWKSSMLYFPPLVCKLLCYCSNVSDFYFSSWDSKHLFTSRATHALTFERCTTDFESYSIRSKEDQFLTIFMIHCVYLAIFLWIYRLLLFWLQREVEKIVAVAWNIFQPFLFGLIGAEVSVTSLRPETVGKIIHWLSSFHY